MLRRLFACLALLTGLAAAAAPAHAGAVAALASQVEASATGVAATQRQAKTAIRAPGLRRDFGGVELFEPAGEQPRIPPTIRLRSDRARE